MTSADDDTAELVPDPHQRTVDRLWDSVDECRDDFAVHYVKHGTLHKHVCKRCKSEPGAFPKCDACDGTGSETGTPVWAMYQVMKAMRKRGLSTYRSKITPERRAG
jgi:hypothetical protein